MTRILYRYGAFWTTCWTPRRLFTVPPSEQVHQFVKEWVLPALKLYEEEIAKAKSVELSVYALPGMGATCNLFLPHIPTS